MTQHQTPPIGKNNDSLGNIAMVNQYRESDFGHHCVCFS